MAITTDPLTTLSSCKNILGITDTIEDTLLSALIVDISAQIAESLGRAILLVSNGANPVTEFLNGNGLANLLLTYRPVQAPVYAGTVTSGSFVITSLEDTDYLFVNQAVTGYGIPPGATIASIDTMASSVTFQTPVNAPQQSATASASSIPVAFDIALWYDDNGLYGGGAGGCFAPITQMQSGGQYTLYRDQLDNSSRSGMIIATQQRFENAWGIQPGGLASYPLPYAGNYKAQYVAGWPSIPSDLELATIRAIAKARQSKLFGDMVLAANFEEQGIQLIARESVLGILGGDVGAVLARDRSSDCGADFG